jgi:hypothetical protein
MIGNTLAALVVLVPSLVCAGTGLDNPPAAVVKLGVTGDGRPTPLWMAAIESRNSDERTAIIRETVRPFTAAEQEWISLLENEVPKWAKTFPGLTLPFTDIPATETVTVLLGNQGGDDGFTHSTAMICLDLSSWVRAYGAATEPGNVGRVHRILSHEYTHLMTRAWSELHPPELSTPLCRALYSIYFEGLGNFYSLSNRWYGPSGLSEQAQHTLEELGPTFVGRLLELQHATPEQEERLREGLSAGPFRKKWGALPAALWLRQEAGNDPIGLRKWVEAGPCGMLDLAGKHLPEQLAERLQDLECDCF